MRPSSCNETFQINRLLFFENVSISYLYLTLFKFAFLKWSGSVFQFLTIELKKKEELENQMNDGAQR